MQDRTDDASRRQTAAEAQARERRHHEVYAKPGLPRFEFCEIADGVWAGRNPLTACDVEALARTGITHVLDLREECEWTKPGWFGVEALDALAAHAIERRHVPVTDQGAPTAAALNQAVAWIGGLAGRDDARVLVHCRAGVERTAAVLIAWYASTHGTSYDTALSALRERRPKMSPLPVQEDAVRRWLP